MAVSLKQDRVPLVAVASSYFSPGGALKGTEGLAWQADYKGLRRLLVDKAIVFPEGGTIYAGNLNLDLLDRPGNDEFSAMEYFTLANRNGLRGLEMEPVFNSNGTSKMPFTQVTSPGLGDAALSTPDVVFVKDAVVTNVTIVDAPETPFVSADLRARLRRAAELPCEQLNALRAADDRGPAPDFSPSGGVKIEWQDRSWRAQAVLQRLTEECSLSLGANSTAGGDKRGDTKELGEIYSALRENIYENVGPEVLRSYPATISQADRAATRRSDTTVYQALLDAVVDLFLYHAQPQSFPGSPRFNNYPSDHHALCVSPRC